MKYLIVGLILSLILAGCSLSQNKLTVNTDSLSVWEEASQLIGINVDKDSSFIEVEAQLNEARLSGDSRELHVAYNKLGLLMYKARKWDKAVQFYYQAADYARISNFKQGEALSLWNMGKSFYKAHATSQAITLYDKAIRIYKQLGDDEKVGRLLNDMQNTYFNAKEYDKADSVLQLSLSIFQDLNHQKYLGYTYLGLGNVAQITKRYEKAILHYHTAEKLVTSSKTKGIIYVNAGEAYTALGRYDEAQRYYKNAYELISPISDTELNIILNYNYGVMLGKVQSDQEIPTYLKNIELIKKVGYTKDGVKTLRKLVSHYENSGEYAKANVYLHQLEQLLEPFAKQKEELEELNTQLEVMMATKNLQENSRLLASAEMKWLLAGLSITVLILAATLAYSDRKRRYYLQQLLSRTRRYAGEEEQVIG